MFTSNLRPPQMLTRTSIHNGQGGGIVVVYPYELVSQNHVNRADFLGLRLPSFAFRLQNRLEIHKHGIEEPNSCTQELDYSKQTSYSLRAL